MTKIDRSCNGCEYEEVQKHLYPCNGCLRISKDRYTAKEGGGDKLTDNELYQKTMSRMAAMEITLDSLIIIQLAREIEYYKEKIHKMENEAPKPAVTAMDLRNMSLELNNHILDIYKLIYTIDNTAYAVTNGRKGLFTPNEVHDALLNHGQRDHERFKVGEIIRYSPSEVDDILEGVVNERKKKE